MNNHYVQDWLVWLTNVRRLKGASIACYSDTMHAFTDWLSVNHAMSSWDEVESTHIEAFMGRERHRNGVGAPATQDRDRVCISQFYNWMMMRGYTPSSPAMNVGVPKIDNRAPKAIDDQVWEQLWQSRMPDEDRVWIGLGCFAGLRRQEIAHLAPAQVDSRRGMLLDLKRKGGKEECLEYEEMATTLADHFPRLLPDPERWLHTVAVAAHDRRGEHVLITMDAPAPATTLRRMSTDDPLAPDPAVLNKRLRKLLVAAELPAGLFSPHALRHTFVTNLLRCGVPIEVVSDLAGHGNIDTTRRYVKSAGRLKEWRTRLAPKETY